MQRGTQGKQCTSRHSWQPLACTEIEQESRRAVATNDLISEAVWLQLTTKSLLFYSILKLPVTNIIMSFFLPGEVELFISFVHDIIRILVLKHKVVNRTLGYILLLGMADMSLI